MIVDKDGDGMKKAKLVAISMNVKKTISVIHLLFVKILMEVSLVDGKYFDLETDLKSAPTIWTL